MSSADGANSALNKRINAAIKITTAPMVNPLLNLERIFNMEVVGDNLIAQRSWYFLENLRRSA